MDNSNKRAVCRLLKTMTRTCGKLAEGRRENWNEIQILQFCESVLYSLGVVFYFDDTSKIWKELKNEE